MKSVLVDRIEYSAADIRGIIGKLERGAPSYEVIGYLNGVANSLDSVAKEVDNEISILEEDIAVWEDT